MTFCPFIGTSDCWDDNITVCIKNTCILFDDVNNNLNKEQ